MIIGVLIGTVQAAIFGVYVHFRDLGLHEPTSDSELGNFHIQGQLLWISILLVASIILVYSALRYLKVHRAGEVTPLTAATEFAVSAFIASQLRGPDGLRAVVLAVVLPAELLVLSWRYGEGSNRERS